MTTRKPQASKPKRYEYHVTYDKAAKLWVCKVGGAVYRTSRDRAWMLSEIAYELGNYRNDVHQHSELIVHRKNGTIGKGPSSRRSYGGDDPKVRG